MNTSLFIVLMLLLPGAAPQLLAASAEGASEEASEGEEAAHGAPAFVVRNWQGWTLRAARCDARDEAVSCRSGVVGRRGTWWWSAEEAKLGPDARMRLQGRVRVYGPSAVTLAAEAATWEQGTLELGRWVAKTVAEQRAKLWREGRWLGADRVSVTMDDERVELEAVQTGRAATRGEERTTRHRPASEVLADDTR